MDPAYLASFLKEMAGRYCGTSLKAIEVWNEQNLNYEWGNLPLSAEAYVRLLAPSSAAIRSACPSMYVVSGALTPSGSVPNVAIDDFVFLEQMLIAGVAQHVDAIGAHPVATMCRPTRSGKMPARLLFSPAIRSTGPATTHTIPGVSAPQWKDTDRRHKILE